MNTPRSRRLIWVRGDPQASERWAAATLANLNPTRVVWLGTTHPVGSGRQHLGQTLEAAVINCHSGLDPDDWGALSGTIQAGGALIVLSPPASTWAKRTEPAPGPWLSHGLRADDLRRGFVERLIRYLSEDPLVEGIDVNAQATDSIDLPAILPDPTIAVDQAKANTEQQRVIDGMTALANQTDPGVVLVTADRGRGKSAALGMAIRALSNQPLRLTGPSRAAVATTYTYAGPSAPAFLAPELITPANTPLFVDEAAALPLGTIRRWLDDNPRCVLAGTVHGYEGSGRGLILRLIEEIKQSTTALTHFQLHTPLRFAPDDPLETWINRLLLLKSSPPTTLPAVSPTSIRIHREDPVALARDDERLAAVFGLLVDAHYQTRPRDLRQLLDDPDMTLWCAWHEQHLVGVLVARSEGGFTPRLSQAVYDGRRRPSGHLIAQSLSFHVGISHAAEQRGLRIQRLAVNPEHRRQGVGQALVDRARAAAVSEHKDWLGTSFGGSAALVNFWQHSGLNCVRVGNRLDPRSAAHALIFLQGLSRAGQTLCQHAQQRFAVHYPNQRQHVLRDLPDDLAARLKCPTLTESIAEIDKADLQAFAHGNRSLCDSHGALTRWYQRASSGLTLSTTQRAVLEVAIADPLDRAAITQAAEVRGQRQALEYLRRTTCNGLKQSNE